MEFHLPPCTHTRDGQERKVGFELEFAGLNGEQIVRVVTDLYGGNVERVNRFLYRIKGTHLGEFNVELDARLLKNQEYLEFIGKFDIETSPHEEWEWLGEMVEGIATIAVPWEVGAPPLPFSRLTEIEGLRRELQLHHARGTKVGLLYAFGLHINIEAPDLSTSTILKTLRAFLIYYPWLLNELHIDPARRLTSYIQEFPEDYLSIVLDPAYHPSATLLVEDYLLQNPTRNRPLDLLPLFSLLNEPLVREKVKEGELIKQRPAFHYRLPNCLVDMPDWRLSTEWNYWVAIEELAADEARLESLGRELLSEIESSPILWKSIWADRFPQLRVA